MRSQERYFGVYFPSCPATMKMNTEITIESAQKEFVKRKHSLFYFLYDMKNP